MPKMKPPTPPKQPSMNCQDWSINAVVIPYQVSPTSWGFDMPTLPQDCDYCTQNYSTPITGSKLRMSGSITGESPVFGANGWSPGTGLDPNFRFVLWRKVAWNETNDRLWSNPDCIRCELREFVLEVPLTPDRWSMVLGGFATPQIMASTLKNIDRIGVTFGAGSNFGHGTGLVSGSASFVCSEFSIVP